MESPEALSAWLENYDAQEEAKKFLGAIENPSNGTNLQIVA